MQVNMHEAKSQLSLLTEKALGGETVVIAKAGKPMVKLVPYTPMDKPRIPGQYKTQIHVPDNLNELDKEIEVLFYGE